MYFTGYGEFGSEEYHLINECVPVVYCAGVVMFEYEQSTVHPSLSASMTYIFHDSEHWTNLWDLFVYNTLIH